MFQLSAVKIHDLVNFVKNRSTLTPSYLFSNIAVNCNFKELEKLI